MSAPSAGWRRDGHGRATVVGSPTAAALLLLVHDAFAAADVHTLLWWIERGDWGTRRLAWELGFVVSGVGRGWLAVLDRDDDRASAHPWLSVPVLEADRLVLRACLDTDVPRIVEACSDARTQRWIGRLPTPYDEVAARRWLDDSTERLASGTAMGWAVVDPADDLMLGSVGWFDWSPDVECEIGYWTHPDARGRRVATRAMAAAIEYAFAELGVARVKAFAAVENTASRHVLESCGLRETGLERLGTHVRDERSEVVLADVVLYDVLASERPSSRDPSRR